MTDLDCATAAKWPLTVQRFVTALVVMPAIAHAAAGNIDTTFGSAGVVISPAAILTAFVDSEARTTAVVYGSTGASVSLARLLPNGAKDNSFGPAAILPSQFQGSVAAIQADGKIVVAGLLLPTPPQAVQLYRFQASGALDLAFGQGGVATLQVPGEIPSAEAIAIQADGKIVLSGQSLLADASGGRPLLARFTNGGVLDTTFGSGGTVFGPYSLTGISTEAVIQPDGKILVSTVIGLTETLERYNADGSLDPSFAFAPGMTHLGITQFAIAPDGNIIVVSGPGGGGSVSYGTSGFSLYRLTANGAFDSGFRGVTIDDLLLFRPDDLGAGLGGMIVQSDGKIVISGDSYSHAGLQIALMRVNIDGSMDTSFGAGGSTVVPPLSSVAYDGATGLILQSDGNLLVPGKSFTQSKTFSTASSVLVRVQDDASGPTSATPNYQGLWWSAAESGWGINFAHSGDQIFATWYTYDTTGRAWWLTMLAARTTPTGSAYAGTLYASSGPPFNNFIPPATATAVGSGTLTFTDVNTGSFAYSVNGVSQTKAITRYDLGTGPQVTCTYSATTPNFAAATNYQDLWWTAAEPGWGINFAQQGNAIFATWYTYNADHTPLWLSALVQRQGTTGVYSGAMYQNSGSRFDAFNTAQVTTNPVGTATLTFADGANATFGYTVMVAPFPGPVTQSKPITRFPFAASGGTVCQ